MARTRSYRAACDAGTAFQVVRSDGRSGGMFPAAETPQEAVTFALRAGLVVEGEAVSCDRHLAGSRVGCAIVEAAAWSGLAFPVAVYEVP